MIDAAFYDGLVRDFSAWGKPLEDEATLANCRRLLEREARLLDQRRFDEWLGLFSAECVYWVPATPQAGDPRREVAVAFDDRRRLEDRIFRLGTGNAWSQAPASRTVHLLSNVEAFENGMVRSNFIISEFRGGGKALWSGWCAHRLKHRAAGLEIEVKQVNLIDCDQNLRNPSLIL